MDNKRLLVIGGTGYIGAGLVNLLSKEYELTVVSRKPREAKTNINNVHGNVLDRKFLEENVKDYDVVIYLAATTRSLRKGVYNQNPEGLKNTIEAMIKNGVRRILYFSTNSVHIKNPGYYGRSKQACEAILKESGLDYALVRPNYVYSIDKENDFYRLYRIAKLLRICPLIGGGKTLIQPIRKEDLVNITVKLIRKWGHEREIEIAGSAPISLEDVSMIIRKRAGPCIKLDIPLSLLMPFKRIIPFDIEGYDQDRVPAKGFKQILGTTDIEEDIRKIISL